MHSLFAQASQLSSSSSQNLRDVDHRKHNMEYIGGWCSISERLKIFWPISSTSFMACDIWTGYLAMLWPLPLLDTFIADSDYTFALSLTISEPYLDPQSNTVSWPVIHWYCDLDLSNEISIEEAEALFGIKVSFDACGTVYEVSKKQLSTIVELNTMFGFDPALEGADICEYFDLPYMEIFENPVEVFAAKWRSGISCLHTLLKKFTDPWEKPNHIAGTC